MRGPHREPADRGGADGGQRDRRRARRRRRRHDAHDLRVHPDAARRAQRCVARCSTSTRTDVRVVAPHVGGAFGGKAGVAAEHFVAVGCRPPARPPGEVDRDALREPAVDAHGRGQVQYVELGLRRATARSPGSACRIIGDAGAYGGFGGAAGRRSDAHDGARRLPDPEDSRSTSRSRPHEHHADGRVPRRRVGPRPRPCSSASWTSPPTSSASTRSSSGAATSSSPTSSRTRRSTGATYDSGDYDLPLRRGAPHRRATTRLRAEQAERGAERGDRVQLGIGVATLRRGHRAAAGGEYGAVEVHADGTATIRVGTSAHGQGHATSFAMIVADRSASRSSAIRFVQSDTARRATRAAAPAGRGRCSSAAARRVPRPTRCSTRRATVAARLLEADPDDIVVTDDGRLGVAGVPAAALAWAEVATPAADDGDAPRWPTSTSSRTARRSRSARTSPSSRSTPRRAASSPSATSRSTTAAASSTRCIVAGQQHGGHRPRASRRRCGSRSSTTTTATR